MTTRPNSATVVDSCTKRLTALKQYLKNIKTPVVLNGETYKATEVAQIYQDCLDTRAALSTKRAEAQKALNERTSAEAKRQAIDSALKPWVINQFGAGSPEALEFGFPPRKKTALSVAEKTQAVAQGQATRKARGTMSKKEKSKIKGVVSAPTAPAAPATPPLASDPTQAAQGVAPQVSTVSAPVAAAGVTVGGAASH